MTNPLHHEVSVPSDVTPGGTLKLLPMADPQYYIDERLSFLHINLVGQIRKTYEGISTLAQSLCQQGMMHPLSVALLKADQLEVYLEAINTVWEGNHTVDDLVEYPGGEERYAVLISGHRRIHAHLELWNVGCEACLAQHGQERPGTCYSRHQLLSPDASVRCNVYRAITANQALEIQCNENLHVAVPVHEQADAYERFFLLRSMNNPDLSLAEFARDFSCDPETIRRARRYCALPAAIRQDVEQKDLNYGLALELGRLAKLRNLSEDQLLSERERILIVRPTAKSFKKSVDILVAKDRAGEVPLFGMGLVIDGERPQRRRVFEQSLVSLLYHTTDYLRRAQPHVASGAIGSNGTWLDTSTRRVMMNTVEAFETILPDLQLRLDETKRAAAVVAEVRELVEEIDLYESLT